MISKSTGCVRAVVGKVAPVFSDHTHSLKQAFWVLMGLAHAPALISVARSVVTESFELERLVGCAVLSLAMLFFALKVYGVAWLRFRTGRRAVVAFCLVVALLHLDVIRSNGAPSIVPECTALIATSWLAVRQPSLRRLLGTTLCRAAPLYKSFLPTAHPTETVWLDAFRPRCWLLAFKFFSLRAPPA